MKTNMRIPEYRNDQWSRKYESHIEPINRFIDELSGKNGLKVPYVAPIYGGVNARMLNIMRDPGPRAGGEKGSGFISMENDDPTAARMFELCEEANIKASDLMPWNIYPWYINNIPSKAQLIEGMEPLQRLLIMLPQLRVIMLHGGDAKRGWKMFEKQFPSFADDRGITIIQTYHTSNQSFIHRNPEVREARKQKLRDDFELAANLLRG